MYTLMLAHPINILTTFELDLDNCTYSCTYVTHYPSWGCSYTKLPTHCTRYSLTYIYVYTSQPLPPRLTRRAQQREFAAGGRDPIDLGANDAVPQQK